MPPADLPPLPDRARLLHIGLMKTGTTAVQTAASARRRQLLAAGVRYPGRRYNHRRPALALMTRPRRPRRNAVPDEWDDLRREVDADLTRRIWISNELICGASTRVAQRFLTELGPLTHVVVTVRSVAAVLPSLWQQYVKTGTAEDLESWLAVVLADPPRRGDRPANFARHDPGLVVHRWARLLGPENLTVVVADKRDPRHLRGAFEALLALPGGILDAPGPGGAAENRSLTAAEAALFLRVNQILRPGQVSRDDLVRMVRNGAITRVLDRPSAEAGPPLMLPGWAAERASAVGRGYAAAIAATGVRVVGNLDALQELPNSDEPHALPDQIPTELAAQALVGVMSGALRRGSNFGRVAPPPLASERGGRRLLRAGRRRLVGWRRTARG